MRRFRRDRGEGRDEDTSAERGSRLRAAPFGVLRLLASLVDLITAAVAIVILIGIAFVVFKANRDNDIVSTVHDAAKWLVGPFDGMFTPKDHKLAVAINWGIALAVYVIVGRFIASMLRRPAARST